MAQEAKIEQYLDTAMWWKGLRETNNEAFLPLFFDQHRYLVLKGGGGSGKSIFAGRKVLERVTSEPGHRWLVTRKVARTLRDSCFAQLGGRLLSITRTPARRSTREICGSGSQRQRDPVCRVGRRGKAEIHLRHHGIWIEEASELEEGDFNQLDIRLRTDFDYYLQMILSFNPVSITHWLKRRFFDTPDLRASVHESTYKDNRFLTPEAVQTWRASRTRTNISTWSTAWASGA